MREIPSHVSFFHATEMAGAINVTISSEVDLEFTIVTEDPTAVIRVHEGGQLRMASLAWPI